MSTLYTVHKQLALKRFSPDGSGPKLSILHGFQMLSGRKYVSFKTLGWEKPEEDVSKKWRVGNALQYTEPLQSGIIR